MQREEVAHETQGEHQTPCVVGVADHHQERCGATRRREGLRQAARAHARRLPLVKWRFVKVAVEQHQDLGGRNPKLVALYCAATTRAHGRFDGRR